MKYLFVCGCTLLLKKNDQHTKQKSRFLLPSGTYYSNYMRKHNSRRRKSTRLLTKICAEILFLTKPNKLKNHSHNDLHTTPKAEKRL